MPDFSDLITATVAVRDSSTPAADLMTIALAHPGLWTKIAVHRNAYPALLDWLAQVGNDEVHEALATRESATTASSDSDSKIIASGTPVTPGVSLDSGAPVASEVPDTSSGPAIHHEMSVHHTDRPTFVVATGLPQGATWDSQQFAPPHIANYAPSPTFIQGPPGEDQHPPTRRRWPLFLVGGLVLVLALALIGWFVVRPLITPSATLNNPVPDLVEEPTATQPVSAITGMNPQFADYYRATVYDAGSTDVGLVAVNVEFARFAEENHDDRWYEGYDEDYATGVVDGTRCERTPQPNSRTDPLGWILWSNLITRPTYCFSTSVGSLARYTSQAGYYDGFTDGMNGTSGATQAHPPVALTETSRISGFSLTDASIMWTFDLSETGLPQAWLPLMLTPNGEGKVATLVRSAEEGHPWQLLVLTVADGTMAAQVTIPNTAIILGYAGDTVLLYTEENADGRLIAYKDSGELAWTKDVADPYFSSTCTGRILAGQWTCANGGYVAVTNGQSASFGHDVGCTLAGTCTTYTADAQGTIYRATWNQTQTSLVSYMKWDTDSNKAQWKNELTGLSSFFADDSHVYTVKDGTLQAYRLKTGTLDWTMDATADDIYVTGTPVGTAGDYVVVYDASAKTVTFVNSSTHDLIGIGERIGDVLVGHRMIYTWDAYSFTLNAWDTQDEDTTPIDWTVKALTTPRVIGSTFVFMLPGNEFYILK